MHNGKDSGDAFIAAQEPAHADRCPYSRPFPRGFCGCATFEPVTFLPADSLNHQLEPVLTCRHLESGTHRDGPGRFYPRCSLGAAADREHWLARVGSERLALLRDLQSEFDELARPHRERIFAAHAAVKQAPASMGHSAQLEDEVSALQAAVDRFISGQRPRLVAAGLPAESLGELIGEWSGGWVRDATTEAGGHGGGAGDDAGERLRISAHAARGRLSVSGEVDASNLERFQAALDDAAAAGGDVEVDLGGLAMCDVGGLRALVLAAEAVAPGHRVVVRGMPPPLRRALELVGWAALPSLVLDPPASAGPLEAAAR